MFFTTVSVIGAVKGGASASVPGNIRYDILAVYNGHSIWCFSSFSSSIKLATVALYAIPISK